MERYTRRFVLKKAGEFLVAGKAMGFGTLFLKPPRSEAEGGGFPSRGSLPFEEGPSFESALEPESENDLELSLNQPRTSFVSREDYLDYIEPQRRLIEGNIAGYPRQVLEGIKELSREREIEEYNRYFPMYKAAEIKFNVPWSLFFILHAHETTFSSDPATYNSHHSGALQRANSWPVSETVEAAQGFELLATLPQRQTYDWREIMWGGQHIRSLAERIYPSLFSSIEEEAYLAVIENNYSASWNATVRVRKYREVKNILQVEAE